MVKGVLKFFLCAMPGIIVVGLQWGDEGKGKIIDLLAKRASHVVRSQGGNNAGHTIKYADREFACHLVPSAILHPHIHCYIGAGCLIDPKVFVEEIQKFESQGIALSHRLHISPRAHLIFPFHRQFDVLYERQKGEKAVGTTLRGIGPCVSDRSSRTGLRIADLTNSEIFREKLKDLVAVKNEELKKIFNEKEIDAEAIYSEYVGYAVQLKSYITDVEERIYAALQRDEAVLFEGAHGTLLDPIYGSYPYVTSSPTLAGGICGGAGIGPNLINKTLGVLKAFTTRVGTGPLPTTLIDEEYEAFTRYDEVREVGTTTGRLRRMGWFDGPLAQYAIRLNGIDSLILTKLDVLDHLDEIKICVGYSLDEKKIVNPPALIEDFDRLKPIYEIVPGWRASTQEIDRFKKLPKNAQGYINKIEEICNVSISAVSVGPRREQMIQMDEDLFS